MTASSLAAGSIAPTERVAVSVASAISEEAVTFSDAFDRRVARLFAVESHTRTRDAKGVTCAVPGSFCFSLFENCIAAAGSQCPNSSLLAGLGMPNPQSSTVLQHAIEIAELARPVVALVQRRDSDLASQLRRAISSIALNLAEARGNAGGNTRVRYESALGSLYEARAGVLLAVAWGYASRASVAGVLGALDCLGGRVFGLAKAPRS